MGHLPCTAARFTVTLAQFSFEINLPRRALQHRQTVCSPDLALTGSPIEPSFMPLTGEIFCAAMSKSFSDGGVIFCDSSARKEQAQGGERQDGFNTLKIHWQTSSIKQVGSAARSTPDT